LDFLQSSFSSTIKNDWIEDLGYESKLWFICGCWEQNQWEGLFVNGWTWQQRFSTSPFGCYEHCRLP
jgi:hypothetical protein